MCGGGKCYICNIRAKDEPADSVPLLEFFHRILANLFYHAGIIAADAIANALCIVNALPVRRIQRDGFGPDEDMTVADPRDGQVLHLSLSCSGADDGLARR